MMLPILISVSLAPLSYFFSACTALAAAHNMAAAASAASFTSTRFLTHIGIATSPGFVTGYIFAGPVLPISLATPALPGKPRLWLRGETALLAAVICD